MYQLDLQAVAQAHKRFSLRMSGRLMVLVKLKDVGRAGWERNYSSLSLSTGAKME